MGKTTKLALVLSFISVASAATLSNSLSRNSNAFSLPFAFVENRGQADHSVKYIGTGSEFKAWFREDGVVLQQGETAVRVTFAGPTLVRRQAGKSAISPGEPVGAKASYIHGAEPSSWQTGLPLYSAIHYHDVWPGVDIAYKAISGRAKAEYVVAPRTQPNEIELRFDGRVTIEPDGTLHIHGLKGDFIEDKPALFQMEGKERREIRGAFRRLPDGCIGFEVGDYNRDEPLVIDPSILFSGFFGGGTQDAITALALDSFGDVIVAGWTSSTNLPTSAGVKKANAGGVDAFVASFAPNGGGLAWCTFLGGSGDDRAFALALDSARNVYITGWTSSSNFPVTAGAYQKTLGGTRDAFVTRLTPTGNAIVYSTFLGGSNVDAGYGIALDNLNNAVIVGDTTSTNLPVTARAPQARNGGGQDAFVAKLSSTGGALQFMTYLGGNETDHAAAVKLDGSSNVWVGGATCSTNFPVASAVQPHSGGGQDGFVSKLSADGSAFLFSTYLGGSGGSVGMPEQVNGIAVDLLGNVIVGGITASANFPVTAGAFATTMTGASDGFVSRFSNSGALLNSTYIGGSLTDQVNAIALDYHGDVYLTGSTISPNFPLVKGLQIVNNGTTNAFVSKLNPTLSSLSFSTYLGGSSSDTGNAIAVDAQTSIVVAGQTSSFDFPTAGAMPTVMQSQMTSFVTRLKPNFALGIDYQSTFVTDPWHVSWDTTVSVFANASALGVTGDWDGTGKKRAGAFYNGTWYLDMNGDGVFGAADKTVSFGQAGDIPVVGDWAGTGHIALGLYRSGTFILDLSGHLTGVPTGKPDAVYAAFGLAGDIPVAADWNGSGATKVGIFRNGQWRVDYNGDGVFNASDKTYTYGQAGDIPVVGDWDSSGNHAKIGIYRQGLWVLDFDGDNAWTVPVLNEMVLAFGGTGMIPLVY